MNNYMMNPNPMMNYGYNRQSNPVYPLAASWVQGVEGAKAFQMSPNGIAVLLDSENESTMYIKSSDSIGMTTLRAFDYTERPVNSSAKAPDLSQYVRKDELQDLIAKMAGDTNEQPV